LKKETQFLTLGNKNFENSVIIHFFWPQSFSQSPGQIHTGEKVIMNQQSLLSLSKDVTVNKVGWTERSLEARKHKSLGHQGSLFWLFMEESHLSEMFCWS